MVGIGRGKERCLTYGGKLAAGGNLMGPRRSGALVVIWQNLEGTRQGHFLFGTGGWAAHGARKAGSMLATLYPEFVPRQTGYFPSSHKPYIIVLYYLHYSNKGLQAHGNFRDQQWPF